MLCENRCLLSTPNCAAARTGFQYDSRWIHELIYTHQRHGLCTQDATTNAKASASTKSNYVFVAGEEKIRLRRQRRLESFTGHEFNSSGGVLENGDSSFSDLNSNTSMSMSSDSSSPTTGSLSSTSESDTNEPSDDSSVYSDPSSLSTVSRLDSNTDSNTESESAGSNPDSGTEADDELDASAPTAEAQLGQLVREFIHDSYSHRYQMARYQLPCGQSQMRHVLDILKPRCPDKFRESLRVSPYTFDQICTKLASDPVFTNNSQNEQIPPL
ncbi:hypothetical protein BDR07DRAFT_1611845 [Suillus spraguei]|nr:hypothetical protein BDR07DRAFT_1611845 [Suillus spraguei]